MAERNRIIRFPLPILGLNTVNPYVEHDSGYARELTNFVIKDGRIFMRPPVSAYSFNSTTANALAAAIRNIHYYDPDSATRDCIISNGSRLNYTTNVTAEAAGVFVRHAMPTELTFSGTATTLNLVFGFYRPLVIDGGTAVAPDNLRPLNRATPFAAAGPYAAFGRPYCGTAHKGRLYYASATYTVEWGSVGQVAGAFPAANTISFEQFLGGQSILRMFSVSASPGATQSQNLFVIFGKGGRVLVFEGDNPGSATWNLIGSYDMPAPASRASFVEIDGDIFVATARYAYWFRDLFTGKAQTAYDNSPSLPIENLWQGVQWIGSESPISDINSHCFYYEPLDAIFCQALTAFTNLIQCFDYEGGTAYFVYLRKYRAWAFCPTARFNHPVKTTSTVAYGLTTLGLLQMASDSASSLDKTIYFDGANWTLKDLPIETSWKTPYAFLERGIGFILKSVRGWFEIQGPNTTSVSIEKSRAIFDHSDLNAPWGFYTQSMVTQINPGRYNETKTTMQYLNYNQYQPSIVLGGDGSCLSMQTTFKGAAASGGYAGGFVNSIYNLSALVQPGSEIF